MRYKIVGFIVWQSGRWYVRRRVNSLLPARRSATAAAILGTVAVVAVVAAQRDSRKIL